MKKKVLAMLIAIVLVVALSISLVACDKDEDESSGFKFSKDMSKEDIIDAINGFDSMTIVYHFIEREDENDIIEYDMIYEYGRTFVVYRIVYQGENNTLSLNFYENGRCYDYLHYYNQPSKDRCEIIDFTGYDVSDKFEYIDEFTLEEFFDDYDYKIENGNLVLEGKGNNYDLTITIKNCNSTTLSIPQEFADYQTKSADCKAVEYVLSDTEDYYSMEMRYVYGVHLNSYEVPETYNGLPVKEVDVSSVINGGTLTLPTTIETLSTSSGSDEPILNIVYKGTKEQWISKELGKYNHGIVVTCSDGKIESSTTEE